MELWFLRILHISSATVWVGAAVAIGFFVLPAIGAAGPGGGAVMRGIVERRFPMVMNVLALVVTLTGARLYMIYFSTAWLGTASGVLLTIGSALGITSALVGSFVQRPLAAELGALGAEVAKSGGPPSAEQQAQLARLAERLRNAARHGAWAMLAAALCMSASRFVPF